MRNFTCILMTGLLGASAATQHVARGAEPPAIQVKVDDYMFHPALLTVHVGDKVTWVNGDQVPHTIVNVEKRFHSAALDTGDQFSFTFTQTGNFKYFCTLHPQMVGTIVVVK